MHFRLFLPFLVLIIVPAFAVHAETSDPALPQSSIAGHQRMISKITITKGRLLYSPITEMQGAAWLVDETTLAQNNVSDVTRAVREVPGVNVQEEEGFGNRPNIGMRGSRIDRSSNITVMEDGVLIAPAPYAAPEAYYFPRVERMHSVEIVKGPAAIKYGPRTTNGAINMISTPVPDVERTRGLVGAGSYGNMRTGLSTGKSWGEYGMVVEHYRTSSDGFKTIDIVGGNTGFDLHDSMAKLRYRASPERELHQEMELKFGYTLEDANETYLGLTDADFNATPYRRYAASQRDNLEAEHKLLQLTHYVEPTSGSSLTTTAYYTGFGRNWYKLQSVRAGGGGYIGLGTVLSDPTTYAAQLAILQGGNSNANDLRIRANKRDYYAFGVQTAWNQRVNTLGGHHDLELGVRYHYDQYDRFQKDDDYQMSGGMMTLTTERQYGTESNRIGEANTIATYLTDRISYGNFSVTPGIRFESINLKTRNYGTSDVSRRGSALQTYKTYLNSWTPGVGADYKLNERWTLIGGVHEGFSPPEPAASESVASNADAEQSINYEAGVRYRHESLHADFIGFYSDYENLLGTDTSSSGGGSSGDQFNGGKVRVLGLEASVGADANQWLNASKALRFPVKATYTLTRANFLSSFNSSFEEWLNVSKGDELPYIPRHQFYVSAGVEAQDWLVSLSGKYNDAARTQAGSGPLTEMRSTDASFVLDFNAEMAAMDPARVFVSVSNLLDEEYIAARRPAGLRPGSPQMIMVGLKADF